MAFRYLIQSTDYTLTSTTSQQQIFNESTNGTLQLPSGVYEFRTLIQIASTGSTSGNAGFDFLGAGTATIESALFHTVGVDSSNPLTASTQGGSLSTSVTSSNPIVSAGAGTGLVMRIYGIVKVQTAGTIIPSIFLNTAAAAVVKKNSCIFIDYIGPFGTHKKGPWS